MTIATQDVIAEGGIATTWNRRVIIEPLLLKKVLIVHRVALANRALELTQALNAARSQVVVAIAIT